MRSANLRNSFLFYIEGASKQGNTARRPEEHLPPPTGRDLPPRGTPPTSLQNQQQPLPPAPDSQTVIDTDPFADPTTAEDTMTGATSQDVHGGIGKPGSGMTSREVRHDGKQKRKRGLQGLEGRYGSANVTGDDIWGEEPEGGYIEE